MVKYSNSWQVGSWRVSSWWVGKLMKSPSTINNTRWQFLHSYLRCQPHGASFRNRLGKIRKAPRRQTGRRSWRCRRWIGRRTPRSSCPGEARQWSSPACHVVRQVADLDGAGVGSVVEHLDPHVQVRPASDHLQLATSSDRSQILTVPALDRSSNTSILMSRWDPLVIISSLAFSSPTVQAITNWVHNNV